MKGNILKIKTLPWNCQWCDTRGLMLYANFQMLENFMIEEAPQNDWTSSPTLVKVWKEINELMKWWKTVKKNESYDNLEKENKMLHRLIEVRGYLWD